MSTGTCFLAAVVVVVVDRGCRVHLALGVFARTTGFRALQRNALIYRRVFGYGAAVRGSITLTRNTRLSLTAKYRPAGSQISCTKLWS